MEIWQNEFRNWKKDWKFRNKWKFGGIFGWENLGKMENMEGKNLKIWEKNMEIIKVY